MVFRVNWDTLNHSDGFCRMAQNKQYIGHNPFAGVGHIHLIEWDRACVWETHACTVHLLLYLFDHVDCAQELV